MPAVCGLNAEAGDNSVFPLKQVSGPDEVQASSWNAAMVKSLNSAILQARFSA